MAQWVSEGQKEGAGRRPRPTIALVINPNAVGIDVRATEVNVAVPTDRDREPVRTSATVALAPEDATPHARPASDIGEGQEVPRVVRQE